MRIIDELTQQEISEPDLNTGELYEAIWAPPEAYASIDNVTKFALSDEDYENVLVYHVLTDDELAVKAHEQAENAEREERQDVLDSLPDALADLSLEVSDGASDTADLADALAELSAIVSGLVERSSNG